MASIHFSGHHFSDVYVAGAVVLLVLVAGIWLMTEGICMVVDQIDGFRAETRARYAALEDAQPNAEAIGAWAARSAYDLLADGDGAAVVGLDDRRHR